MRSPWKLITGIVSRGKPELSDEAEREIQALPGSMRERLPVRFRQLRHRHIPLYIPPRRGRPSRLQSAQSMALHD